jgi:ABC-2 type transport system permease protein
MKKFWYLVRYGLKKKIKAKSFIISNIVIFLLLLVVFNIDSIISYFGGNFDKVSNIYVVDNTNELFNDFNNNYVEYSNMTASTSKNKIIKSEESREVLDEKIKDSSDIIIEFNIDQNNYYSAKVISDSQIDNITYEVITQSINNAKAKKALIKSNIDIEELERISSSVDIERIILNENKGSSEDQSNILDSFVFPTIIMPFFMLIVLLVQLIGGEINEEKTTRSMEIIISNVPVKVHFYSKLIANNAFVILQAILIFLYGAIGIFVKNMFSSSSDSGILGTIGSAFDSLSKTGLMDKMYYIIPLFIILMLLSFVAYSLISGIFASMTVNPEDFQSIQTPIMIICLISYYLAIMANMFDGSIFIRVLSYVPLMSFLLSPALLLVGQIGVIDVVISVVLLLVFDLVVTKYGLRIYKVGILNYSTDKLWKRIFKATKM